MGSFFNIDVFVIMVAYGKSNSGVMSDWMAVVDCGTPVFAGLQCSNTIQR